MVSTADRSSTMVQLMAIAIIFVGTLMLPTTAVAQMAMTVGPIPSSETIMNPCTGEAVTVTGQTILHVYFVGTHFTTHTTTHETGVTTTAVVPRKYEVNFDQTFEGNLPSTGATEFSFVEDSMFIRQAEDPSVVLPIANDDDFRSFVMFHFTITASGMPSATVTQDRQSCPTM
jgi:hypothetical protein